MMLIKKISFVRKVRRWKMVFWLKDPWMRREFENVADEMGVKYETQFDSPNNIMAYIILDVRDGDVERFLRTWIGGRADKFKYFHQEVLGVRFVNIADSI